MFARGFVVFTLALMALSLAGCSGDTEAQLQAPLEGIAKVKIGDQIEVECASGDKMQVSTEEIGLNFMGMGDVEKMTGVAKKIQTFCDQQEKERRAAQRQGEAIDELIKERGLSVEGDDLEAKRKAACHELTLTLPADPDTRTEQVTRNRNTYGCDDPGKPDEQPQRAWQISHDPASGSATVKLEVDGGKGELIFRCNKKSLKAYVKTGERMRRGKVSARLDQKRASWAVKTSGDKKYIFLPSPAARAKELAGVEKLTITYKNARKKSRTKSFPTAGFDAALPVLQRYCKI